MTKILFEINYNIYPEKREEYLKLVVLKTKKQNKLFAQDIILLFKLLRYYFEKCFS